MADYIDAVTDALQRLDDLGYERGGDDFANHRPMGAEALAALGFTAEEAPDWVRAASDSCASSVAIRS